jgi:5'-methylthioadenosine phosphorylase
MKIKIGIIGGSGIDSPDILENKETISVETDFGVPSSDVSVGTILGVDVAIIARHGPGHIINPTNVPYAANIAALKKIGCTHIIGATAVGSLKEEYKPGDIVISDQFIDRTTKRIQTFYNEDKVCHISVSEPFCVSLRNLLIQGAKELSIPFHEKGCCVVIEGPRFSSKAESNLFRSWNAEIIGMTLVPEAILAREAEIPYANISMITDYDVWREGNEVSTQEVIETMKQNVEKVKMLLKNVIPKIQYNTENPIRSALKGAMF